LQIAWSCMCRHGRWSLPLLPRGEESTRVSPTPDPRGPSQAALDDDPDTLSSHVASSTTISVKRFSGINGINCPIHAYETTTQRVVIQHHWPASSRPPIPRCFRTSTSSHSKQHQDRTHERQTRHCQHELQRRAIALQRWRCPSGLLSRCATGG
jgi:hypothetical protein